MANTKIQSEQIADLAIVTDRIAADAVTTAKIADNVALGGSPTTTTQSASDNSTKIATTEYVTTAISSLIDSAPSTLNTLNEIAAALNDDANFNTTVTNSIAAKLPLAGGTMTGALNMGSQNITNAGDISGGIFTAESASDYPLRVKSTDAFAGIVLQDSSSTTNGNVISVTGDTMNFFTGGTNSGTDIALTLASNNNATFTGTITSGAITSSGAITGAQDFKATGNNMKLHAGGNHIINMDLNGKFYPETHNSVDLGYSIALAFRNLYLSGTISSGAITSSGASSGRYTGLEVVNTTNAAGTETAIGLGVLSASNNACDVKLVANRVGSNSGSDFYIEQTDATGNQDETFRITENGNATFAGTISSGAITSSGSITGQKLVSTDGVLELDDNGTHNGIINVPASLRINIDSDNNNTGEAFQIGNNVTNISNSNILFEVDESGDVEISNAGDLTLKNPNAAPTNSVSAPGALIFQGNGWDSNAGSKTIRAKIVHSASYGDHGSGATQGALIFYMQGAGGLDSSPDTQQEAMRLDAGGAYHTGHPNLGINTSDIFNTLHVRGDSGQEAESLISVSSGGSTDYIDLYKVHGSYPHRGGGR